MPASDYTSTISGGLKLKGGAKDAGVKKKSKKSKSSKDKAAAAKPSTPQEGEEAGDSKTPNTDLALSTTHSDRDATPSDQQPSSSSTGTGKTEAQRRHEEIKRKRVSYTTKHTHFATSSNRNANIYGFVQLDDRLKREGGAKTHKQRVEELNKYLSTLSEHHDMPRIGPG
jgi:protein FAM32A